MKKIENLDFKRMMQCHQYLLEQEKQLSKIYLAFGSALTGVGALGVTLATASPESYSKAFFPIMLTTTVCGTVFAIVNAFSVLDTKRKIKDDRKYNGNLLKVDLGVKYKGIDFEKSNLDNNKDEEMLRQN